MLAHILPALGAPGRVYKPFFQARLVINVGAGELEMVLATLDILETDDANGHGVGLGGAGVHTALWCSERQIGADARKACVY
jgi:hypothetical protein